MVSWFKKLFGVHNDVEKITPPDASINLSCRLNSLIDDIIWSDSTYSSRNQIIDDLVRLLNSIKSYDTTNIHDSDIQIISNELLTIDDNINNQKVKLKPLILMKD